jgi:DNA-binding Xre family transcriptional regulator
MLLHQAFNEMLKYCEISAKDLSEVTGISNSRISQFRRGTFLEGKGSDLTTRSLDELLTGAEKLNPKARVVFSALLMDKNPELIDLEISPEMNRTVSLGRWRRIIWTIDDKDAQEIALALAEKYSVNRKGSCLVYDNQARLSA